MTAVPAAGGDGQPPPAAGPGGTAVVVTEDDGAGSALLAARGDSTPRHRGARALRPAVTWAAILVTGLVLLAGRFDWSADRRYFARRGWLLSGYLLVLVLPLLYYLVRTLSGRPRVAATATSVAFVVLTLPYRWVGLDGLYHESGRATPWYRFALDNPLLDDPVLGSVDNVPLPRAQFLFGGPWSTFPHDVALFAGVSAVAVAAGLWAWRRARDDRASRRRTTMVVALFLAIVVQTFLHAGVRAPYAYTPYFQEPEASQAWYAVAMFDDGSGVVNADQFAFSAVEDYFHGAPRETNNMLIRRPLSFYAAAQFTYFANALYVWIVLNVLLWFAAALAGAALARKLAGPRAGLFVGAMIGCGTGFVAFVGTPGMYLGHYAVVVIALYLLERLLADGSGSGRFVLFTAGLGACALVYDLLVLFPVLLAYGLARRVAWRPLTAALVGAFLVYRGFLFLHNTVLDIPVVPTNAEQAEAAARAVRDLALHPSIGTWIAEATDVVSAFGSMLTTMFFVLPALAALVGIRFVRGRAQVALVVGLLAMTFVTVAFLRVGDLAIGELPRFVYPAYPAVYLLAALALSAVPERGRSSAVTRALQAAPWAFVALVFLLSNVDAWGYPGMYSEALEGGPPMFVP